MALFVVNLWADARFGRQEEGFSEEPMLTAAMAAACVEGAHGSAGLPPDAYLGPRAAAALFKHVGAYGAAAGGLNSGRADAPEVTVRDVYLKPWRRAAQAGSRGVMPSHNTVLGAPAHGSPWLLSQVGAAGRPLRYPQPPRHATPAPAPSQVLRGEFNMTGAVFLSDTGDVQNLGAYRICSGDYECAARAINAGVDIEQPPGQTYLSLPQVRAPPLPSGTPPALPAPRPGRRGGPREPVDDRRRRRARPDAQVLRGALRRPPRQRVRCVRGRQRACAQGARAGAARRGISVGGI